MQATATQLEAIRVHAVDQDFVYSMHRSTIFCRPSCGSRTVSGGGGGGGEAVVIAVYHTAQDARRAGLVPCKRCNPHRNDTRARAPRAKVLRICQQMVESQQHAEWRDVVTRNGFSLHHGHRTFRAMMDMTPLDFQKLACNSKADAIAKMHALAGGEVEGPELKLKNEEHDHRQEGEAVAVHNALYTGGCSLELQDPSNDTVEDQSLVLGSGLLSPPVTPTFGSTFSQGCTIDRFKYDQVMDPNSSDCPMMT